MEKLHFTQEINATAAKVWHAMLDDKTYREWTLAFNPHGSWYEGDWTEGSTIKFIGPNPAEPTKLGGMLSRVKENRKYEFISIEHVGMIFDGVEDTTSDLVKKWVPAFENYTFEEKDGKTTVTVDVDVEESMVEEFSGMWPKALLNLKEIAEK